MAAPAIGVLAPFLVACDIAEPRVDVMEPSVGGSSPVVRRLTQDQYKNVIKHAFGPDITFGGRMDPDLRLDGLIALGATESTVTPASFEQYDSLARSIAAQVMEPNRRNVYFSCDPARDGALDKACAATIIQRAGRILFRRPLASEQIENYVGVTAVAAVRLKDPYKGLQYGLSAILASPAFLFRKDHVEPTPEGGEHDEQLRLDAYSKAARLSFFLWDAGPDEQLLAAADSGEINQEAGLRDQVERMIASPRLVDGVRAFFRDFLQLSLFESVGKDSVIYPKFSPAVAIDAPEQTLRTVTHHLIDKGQDYRDLFTTRSTFMSRALGVVYQVPVDPGLAWTPYEFEQDDPRAGLLSQLSFTALYSLPGRSSPTLRGKAVREILMCQSVPIPPADVDFSQFEAASNEGQDTARNRLAAHVSEPTCAGCHKIIDPIGLSLENFDGLGALRETEGGTVIDASGTIDGVAYSGPAGLGKALHDNKNVPACVVRQLYAYGTGRRSPKTETEWIEFLVQSFARDGYNFKSLLRRVATSENFYRVSPSLEDVHRAALNTTR